MSAAIWVMILMIRTEAVTTQEFHSYESCMAAGKAVQAAREEAGTRPAIFVCSAK